MLSVVLQRLCLDRVTCAHAMPEIGERRVVDEDRAHGRRHQLPEHDQADDGDQDRAHEVVVEALERREQRAADAARAELRRLESSW